MNEEVENNRHHRIVKSDGYAFGFRSEANSAQAKIKEALIKNHPDKSLEQIEALAKQVILEPERFKDEALMLVERIEGERGILAKDKVEKQEAKGDRGYIRRAELIEAINSGTYTQEEYFTWIEDGAKIIKNMNDGRVTPQDLDAKIDMLTQLDQREIELMVCLSLYSSSGVMEGDSIESQKTRARFDELKQKLTKLREIRSAVKRTTKDKADEETKKEEYGRNIPFVFVMAEIGRHIKNKRYEEADFSRSKLRDNLAGLGLTDYDKMEMGMYPYDHDFDILVKKEINNLNLKMQNNSLKTKTEFYAEYFHGKEDALERSRDIRRKILSLQGIDTMKQKARIKTILDAKDVDSIRRKQFDMTRYNILENALKYENNR